MIFSLSIPPKGGHVTNCGGFGADYLNISHAISKDTNTADDTKHLHLLPG